MRDTLDVLVDLLALERIERDLFRGRSQDLGWGRIFGGQVLGQALSAAAQTVEPDRHVHSMHGYFLRSGDVNRPVVYEVDRIRDGKSFTTRRVVAIQDGQAIFNLAASFHADEDGFEHQDPMPELPPPESLLSVRDRLAAVVDRIPPPLRKPAMADWPIETRPVDPQDVFAPTILEPVQATWFRARHALPDDPALHRYLLAYASDSGFLTTALRPHGVTWLQPGMHVASLDHAMWFHRPVRVDEWVAHVVESPVARGGRAMVRGRFFTRDGQLVATTAQEGLIRPPADDTVPG